MARTPKLDAALGGAAETARAALAQLEAPESIGAHLGVTAEGDRVATHRFVALLEGYRGWEWYVTLARASRAKEITVDESGLLPGPDALLSPDWVPWSERIRPDEVEHDAVAQAEEAQAAPADADESGEPASGEPDSGRNDDDA